MSATQQQLHAAWDDGRWAEYRRTHGESDVLASGLWRVEPDGTWVADGPGFRTDFEGALRFVFEREVLGVGF